MGRFIDLSGKRFGKLLAMQVARRSSRSSGPILYKCVCDCGNVCIVRSNNLRSGNTTSCGCARDALNGAFSPNPKRLYNSWRAMKARCQSPNNNRYRLYGGRGISVCREWQTFRNFEEWALKNGFENHLSIDRIDANGNYCPSNCRWIPPQAQSSTRRCARNGSKKSQNQIQHT